MYLSDILDQLAYGELASLSISGEDGEGISPEKYKAVVTNVNLGLTALHKRFPLKAGEIILNQIEGQTYYRLHSKYAVSNTDSLETKFIDDTLGFPFEDDLLKIEQIFDEEGIELPLNNHSNENSLFTPKFNVLQIPPTLANVDNSLTIKYRANHPKIIVDEDLDASTEEIDISLSYLEPLLYFIASRLHSNVPSIEGDTGEGIKFANKYEHACIQLENFNAGNKEQFTNCKLEEDGWE